MNDPIPAMKRELTRMMTADFALHHRDLIEHEELSPEFIALKDGVFVDLPNPGGSSRGYVLRKGDTVHFNVSFELNVW